uniref:Uncharacterized protein n=1 Tax=Anguilla anguilla TaxID=7936 RepID=A0A0E9XFW2_ANGAN
MSEGVLPSDPGFCSACCRLLSFCCSVKRLCDSSLYKALYK